MAQPKPTISSSATATTGGNSRTVTPAATKSGFNNPRSSVPKIGDHCRELVSINGLREVHLVTLRERPHTIFRARISRERECRRMPTFRLRQLANLFDHPVT